MNPTEPTLEMLQQGALWTPWWCDPTHAPASVRRPDLRGLVYRLERCTLPLDEVAPSSELWDVDGEHAALFWKPEDTTLLEDIEQHGQREPAIVVDCNLAFSGPVKSTLRTDPTLQKLHVLHGHHRYAVCKRLGRPLDAWLVSVMLYPRAAWVGPFKALYEHRYSDTEWTLPQSDDTKGPWFQPAHFRSLAACPKEAALAEGFAAVKDLGLPLHSGVDVGAAEGAYAWHAQQSLGIPFVGLEAEPARVLRGLLHRAHFGVGCVLYPWNVSDKPHPELLAADFALVTALLHHVDQPEQVFQTLATGKRAMLLETRSVSVETVHTWFSRAGMQVRTLRETEDNRKYFLGWRPTT